MKLRHCGVILAGIHILMLDSRWNHSEMTAKISRNSVFSNPLLFEACWVPGRIAASG